MVRVAGMRALSAALALASFLSASPAQALCELPPIAVEAAAESGSAVSFSVPGATIVWTTPDGRRLTAAPATIRRTTTRATASFQSRDLTIIVRADLVRGLVQGSAVERLPGYGVVPPRDPRRPKPVRIRPDPNRRSYTLSTRTGVSLGGACLAGPGQAPRYVGSGD